MQGTDESRRIGLANGDCLYLHATSVRQSRCVIDGPCRAPVLRKKLRPQRVHRGHVAQVDERDVHEDDLVSAEARRRERAEDILEREGGFLPRTAGRKVPVSSTASWPLT